MASRILFTLALLDTSVFAFPHIAEMVAKQQLDKRIQPVADFPEYPGSPAHAQYNKFDPKTQLVDVHGEHEFQAPGPNDIRGPCAGLNAAANHGYIPRNGIATDESINTGLWEAFSLDKTATIFLETATRFFDGNPITGEWSIGRASDAVNLLPGNPTGTPSGICNYGHLKTEGDASITRGDFLAPTENDNCESYPDFTKELFNLADQMEPATGHLTPRVYAQHQANRKQHSIATNPNYFSPAYAGVAFTFGAHMFAYHLLANHSAEYPRGFQTKELFMSIWGYSQDADGTLHYNQGMERIPENFYKRAPDDAWTLTDILISTAQQCEAYPSNCQVGGNTGTVNSFDGFDLGNITGGFINSASDLSDPDRMGCFISQSIQADAPSFLTSVFQGALLQQAMGLIGSQLLPALAPLTNSGACPNLPQGARMADYGAKYPGGKVQSSGPRD